MGTQYATRADLAAYATTAVAIESIPTATQDAALEARSRWLDGYFAAQFQLPLLTWESDVKLAVAKAAAYDLAVARGFNPNAPGDDNLRIGLEEATRWAVDVARGIVIPQVTDSSPSESGGTTDAPIVVSGTQRGWSRRGTTRTGGGFIGD